eukprot:366477-Chlamydomonas_euryale.AAC.2
MTPQRATQPHKESCILHETAEAPLHGLRPLGRRAAQCCARGLALAAQPTSQTTSLAGTGDESPSQPGRGAVGNLIRLHRCNLVEAQVVVEGVDDQRLHRCRQRLALHTQRNSRGGSECVVGGGEEGGVLHPEKLVRQYSNSNSSGGGGGRGRSAPPAGVPYARKVLRQELRVWGM